MNKSSFEAHFSTVLKLLVFVVFFALGMSQAKAEIQSAYDIMTLEDSFECNDKAPHHSFCEAVQFKPWTASEREIVETYLKRINDPRLAFFFKKIKEKGITKIHRVTYSSNWYNNASKRRVEFVRSTAALLWVSPVTNVIGFTDDFFTGASFLDPYAQMERKQLNILHELSHVFDVAMGHISSEGEFQKVAGWQWNGKEFEVKGVGAPKAADNFKAILDLIKNGQTAGAYAHDRELGRELGFPTAYGMVNSHESFAEFLTYFIFDPTAESYFSPEMIQYLNNILKVN